LKEYRPSTVGLSDAWLARVNVAAAKNNATRHRFSMPGNPRAIPLLKVMPRSPPVELPRLFFACGVLAVKGIRQVFQSIPAIELAQCQ